MTAPRRRMIVKELCEEFHVSQRRVLRGWTWPGPAFAICRSFAMSRRAGSTLRGTGRGPTAVRLPADLGLAGSRGLDGQQEGRALTLSRVGAESGPTAGDPKPRRAHGQDENACHLRPVVGKNDVWTWDFIFDRTSDGRSLKWLSIVDEYTRECLALEPRGV